MRKLALFTFLLLYTGSVVGLTVERTATWVTEHRRVVEHPGSDRGPHLCESRKHSAHPLQTKLLEDGSVFVPTFVRSSDPPGCERDLLDLLSGFVATQSGRIIPPRAPPALL